MDEFSKKNKDHEKIMRLDALMRKNNENRRVLWNELNTAFSELLKNKKYEL
jgi:hypothetical protein